MKNESEENENESLSVENFLKFLTDIEEKIQFLFKLNPIKLDSDVIKMDPKPALNPKPRSNRSLFLFFSHFQ